MGGARCSDGALARSWALSPAITRGLAGIVVALLLIVAAELVGEGLVVVVSDRIGLRRRMTAGLLLSAPAYLALGLVGRHAGLAFAAVAVLFVAFEVTVVVVIAYVSTIAQRSRDRARLLGALMAAVACGNAVGAVVAPPVFARGGIALLGAQAAAAAAAATAILLISGPRTSRAGGDAAHHAERHVRWRAGPARRRSRERNRRESDEKPRAGIPYSAGGVARSQVPGLVGADDHGMRRGERTEW